MVSARLPAGSAPQAPGEALGRTSGAPFFVHSFSPFLIPLGKPWGGRQVPLRLAGGALALLSQDPAPD
jgi:hypothetical protein